MTSKIVKGSTRKAAKRRQPTRQRYAGPRIPASIANAKEKVSWGLSRLACVRDILDRQAQGDKLGFAEEEEAFFVSACLVAAASGLEVALVELGAIEAGQNIFGETGHVAQKGGAQ